jgi:hypothetical protein
MNESTTQNKLIGVLGIILGLVSWGSLLVGDNTKLIIPEAKLFLVKYFSLICIIDGGLFFIVAGVLIFMGLNVHAYPKASIQYKEIKAKGILLSIFLLSPFFISFFTIIFTMSENNFWKIAGGLVLGYISWLLCYNVTVLLRRRQRDDDLF